MTDTKTGGFACNKSSLDRCKSSAAYDYLWDVWQHDSLWFFRDVKQHGRRCCMKFHSLTQSIRWKLIKKLIRSPSNKNFELLKLPLFVIWSIVLWLCGDEEKLYARIKLTLLALLHFKTYFSWVNIKEIIAGINYLWTEV